MNFAIFQGIFSQRLSTAHMRWNVLVLLEMEESGFAVCLVSKRKRTVSSILSVSYLKSFIFIVLFLITIGINYESSFEAEILAGTNHCQIWGYDFSVKSFGPEIPAHQLSRTHFKAFGLGGEDAHHAEPPMYTLESLMKMNGTYTLNIMRVKLSPLTNSMNRPHSYRYPED